MEKKLVGEWVSGCSIDICTVTTLNADHTFSGRFDEKGFSEPSYFGTWHVERNQLVMHVTWANKALQDIVGKDLRLIISEFQQKKFTAIPTEDRTKPVTDFHAKHRPIAGCCGDQLYVMKLPRELK